MKNKPSLQVLYTAGTLIVFLFLTPGITQTAPTHSHVDLGVRPNVDGVMISKLPDPSKENLERSKIQLMRQGRMSAVAVLERIWLSPLKKAIATRARSEAAAEYEKRSADPRGFEIFGVNQTQINPTSTTTAAFINREEEYKGIAKIEYGVCWGVTTMNRRFAQLAFFPSVTSLTKPEDLLPDSVSRRKDWIKEIIRRVEYVMEGQAQIFPGIRNIRELTLIPEVERHLKVLTVKAWRNLAIRPWDRKFFTDTTEPMTPDSRNALVEDLERRISRHELPKLMFTKQTSGKSFGVPYWIHTVLATGVKRLDGGTIHIMVWDPDFYGEDYPDVATSVEIRPDGSMLYRPWYRKNDPEWSDRLGQVFYAPENNSETLMIEKSLLKFCEKRSELCVIPAEQ